MKKRTILAIALALTCALPAIANPVTQIGVDNSYPTSSSNPFPVTISGSGSGTSKVDITKLQSATPSATNAMPSQITNGTNYNDSTHPLYVSPSTGATQQDVNVKQINGATPLMGNGASGTGAQRVTIASDSTGQIALVMSGTAVTQTNPLAVTGATLATASIVNAAADIVTTTSTVINLGVTSRKITVKNCDITAVMNVDIKAGTASVSNGVRLDPGVAYTFTPALGASSFSYYSTAPTSATKTLTYAAE